jgi:hypothetical protein
MLIKKENPRKCEGFRPEKGMTVSGNSCKIKTKWRKPRGFAVLIG